MKVISKALKFARENKIIVFALFIVLLSFVFLALPGQFAHIEAANLNSKVASERFKYRLSGYEWIFATVKTKLGAKIGTVSAQGITIFVMLILCVPGLLFSKKSSFVSLLTSLAMVTLAILFYTLGPVNLKAYAEVTKGMVAEEFHYLMWVPWLTGSLIMVAGLLMCWRTFLALKDEVQHPVQPKGPHYNYLHK